MHTKLLGRTLSLLLFAAAPFAAHATDAAPEPAQLRLDILHRDASGARVTTPIPFDEHGSRLLEQIFSDHFACGNGHGVAGELTECLEGAGSGLPTFLEDSLQASVGKAASNTYRLARYLMDTPEARRQLETIGGWGRSRVLRLRIRLADGGAELGRGDRLRVRNAEGEFEEIEVDGTRTLQQLADEHGVTRDQLQEWNSHRVEIWPHCSTGNCIERRRGRPVLASTIRLGEKNMDGSRRDGFDSAWGTMLHEAAHASDDAPDPETNYRYGPDGTHYLSEIISPANAFGEGWAEFVPASLDPDNTSALISRVTAAELPQDFRIEKVDVAGEHDGYRRVTRDQLSPSQLLANEIVVARILHRVRPLFRDFTQMGAAFRATNSFRGRHIGTYLAELCARFVPGQIWGTQGDPSSWGGTLRGIIRVLVAETGMSQGQAWGMLRSGRIPDGRTGGAAPGALPLVAEAPEAEQPRAPQVPSLGFFGMD